jgi:hypothetical protein
MVEATATVRLGLLTASGGFVLAQVVSHPTPTSVGGYAYLPPHPVYSSDAVVLYLYAFAGSSSVDAVDITVC